MNHLNSVLIEGRLTQDPLFRTTPQGASLCTFIIGSNIWHKEDAGLGKETYFFEVEAWSRLGEHCYKQGREGRSVRVAGRLKQTRLTGTDGGGHFRITIVAEHVEFHPESARDDEAGKTAK